MDQLAVLVARSEVVWTHQFGTVYRVYAVIELCVEHPVDVDVENERVVLRDFFLSSAPC